MNTIHVRDHSGALRAEDIRWTRGVGDIAVHIEREAGQVDCYTLTSNGGMTSRGVATSVLGCGCP